MKVTFSCNVFAALGSGLEMLCSLSSEAAVNNMISNADLQEKMHFYLCLQNEKKNNKTKTNCDACAHSLRPFTCGIQLWTEFIFSAHSSQKKNPSEMRTILVPYLTLKQVCQTSGLGVRNSPPETPIWSAGRLRKTCRRADM